MFALSTQIPENKLMQEAKGDSLKVSTPITGEAKEAIATEPEQDTEPVEFQYGVQKARGITSTWTRRSMWTIFALLWIVSLADQLLVSVNGALGPYMTSRFQRHGLVATTSIISTIAGGTSHLTFAKLSDILGRIQTFLFTLVLQAVAQIMKAASQNIETYVAGEVFYWVAHIGMIGVIDIIIADITTLKNRMIMFGINGTPLIISVFAGPEIAAHFLKVNMKWAFGAFAIILTAVSIPPVALLLWWEHKAFQSGTIQKRISHRTRWQSIVHYFIQFDIVGIFLLTAAFGVFLLPFSLSAYAPDGWASDYIIAMLVVGFVLFPCFYVWERYFTLVPFLKWQYIKDRTIIGSAILYSVLFMSTFCWNAYFRSYLQVVHRLSVQTADYTLNTYSLSSAFITPFIGWFISVYGRFKWIAYCGLPILLLGTALLIPFRSPDTGVGLLVMTQLFVGIGAGIFATCGCLAVMAPVTQQEIAAVLAVWGLFASIGASTGFAIAGALWNNILPEQLAKRLPADSQYSATEVFASLEMQMSFADGSPERDAVVGAYGYVQRVMVIVGACLIPLCLFAIFIWKDINVKKLEREHGEQTKGNVF